MKRALLTVLFVFFAHSALNAMTVTLIWEPSPSDGVAGYKIHCNQESNTPEEFNGTCGDLGNSPIDVGDVLTKTLDGLPNTIETHFAVTAYDTLAKESKYSNIVNSELEEYDKSNISMGPNVYIDSQGIIHADISVPTDLYFTEPRGFVAKGEVLTFLSKSYFKGSSSSTSITYNSPFRFYLRDTSTGERVSTEKYLFVDDSYKSYQEKVIITKNTESAELVVEFGEKEGQYQVQVSAIDLTIPEFRPIENLRVSEIRKASPETISAYAAIGLNVDTDVIFSFSQPVGPNPESYTVTTAKTLEGVLVERSWPQENPVIFRMDIVNSEQNEQSVTLSPSLKSRGFFISIKANYPDGQSASNVEYYLSGNILDSSPDFKDRTIDSVDSDEARDIYGGRGGTDESKEFFDLNHDGITRRDRDDYYYIRGRVSEYITPFIYYEYILK